MSSSSHIRFDFIESSIDQFSTAFASGSPFPHVAIDGFLEPTSLAALVEAVPSPDRANKSNDYLFARNKFENPTFAGAPTIFQQLREELLSERFARLIGSIYGKPVFIDPQFVGGGIHQGGEGSFLDMHADFSRHPTYKDWLRELNILLYLNKDYSEDFGGHLEMQHATTGERGRVAPIANRLVVMLTKAHTLHGYKRITFPKGQYRTSLAAYAYSVDNDFDAEPARSTLWKPEDAGTGKNLLARAAPALVRLKTALVGSSTARRASSGRDKDR